MSVPLCYLALNRFRLHIEIGCIHRCHPDLSVHASDLLGQNLLDLKRQQGGQNHGYAMDGPLQESGPGVCTTLWEYR